jgi:hypothetical protein
MYLWAFIQFYFFIPRTACYPKRKPGKQKVSPVEYYLIRLLQLGRPLETISYLFSELDFIPLDINLKTKSPIPNSLPK